MKQFYSILTIALLFFSSCTSQKKLAYLGNLPESGGEQTFLVDYPDYRIKARDILHVSVKAMTPDGTIMDFLSPTKNVQPINYGQAESGGYIYGYDVNSEGDLLIPVLGKVKVSGLTLEETRKILQSAADKVFNNSTVECKLLSFKFTVIGEVRAPGTYLNYNNYLTVLEAIGRAGGLGDYGDRSKVLVIHRGEKENTTYKLNLQDKKILSSEAYYLLPNDIVIVEPLRQKIFNMNLPTFTFILTAITSSITTTLLLINYFGK